MQYLASRRPTILDVAAHHDDDFVCAFPNLISDLADAFRQKGRQ